MSRPCGWARLALAAGGLALLGATACVSKSTYLAKIDEAVRFRRSAETCKRDVRKLTDIRADLEQQLKAVDRRRAVVRFERKRCDQERGQLRQVAAKLRTSLRETSDQVNELRAKLATTRESVRGLRGRVSQMRAAARKLPDLSDVERALRPEVQTEPRLTVEKRKRSVALRIPEGVLFERRRRATLSRDGRELLGRLADALRRLPRRSVLVQGHQSAGRVPRRYRSPLELSLLQAYAAGRQLIRDGFPAERLELAGLGTTRPQRTGTEPDEQAQNRRIELVVSPTQPQDRIEVIGPGPAPRPRP